jgi:hypothetical protein
VTCVDHRLLIWAEGRDLREERVATPWAPGKYLAGLGWGEPDLFRRPTSYARTRRPLGTTQVAGRTCHEVHLSGSPDRPGDLEVAIDHDSFLVLAWHDRASGQWAQVEDLTLDGPVDADVFTLPAEDRALLGARTRRELATSMAERIVLPPTLPHSNETVSWSLIDGDPVSGAYLASGRRDNRRRVELLRQPKAGPAPLQGSREWTPQQIMSWTEGDFTFDLLLE